MAKISTKTFNPMAGVSLPGWALESYQSTSANLADVVDSLTSAYNQQQEREQKVAFDVARLNQNQSQFDEQMEFSRQQDAKDRAFADRQARRQRDEHRYKMSLEEDRIVSAARKQRYDRGADALNVLVGDATPADWETTEVMLDGFNTQGLADLDNLREVYRARLVTKGKEDYTDRQNITSSFLYNDNYTNLDEARQKEVDMFARQTYDPSSKDNFANIMINRWAPQLSPIYQERYKTELAGYKEQMKGIFLLPVGERKAASKAISDGMDAIVAKATGGGLGVTRRGAISPGGEGSQYLEESWADKKISPGNTIQVQSENYGKVSVNKDDYIVDNGVKYYNATKADGSEVIIPLAEFEENVPAGTVGWSEAPKEPEDESTWWDDIMYGPRSLETISRYATRGIAGGSGVAPSDVLPDWEQVKQVPSEVAALTSLALEKGGFGLLGYQSRPEDYAIAGEVGKRFVEKAVGIDDAIGERIVSPVIEGGINMASTAMQYFPNLLERREQEMLAQDPKVLEMWGQGMNLPDAIFQRKKEIKEEQGGVFYSGVGASEKYATKEQLRDGGIFKGKITDEGLAKLPKRMINPEWVERKALEFSSAVDKEVAGLSDLLGGYSDIRKDYLALKPQDRKRGGEKVTAYRAAGNLITDKSSNLSNIKKELISYRNDIKKAEKYKAEGAYNVSSKNVDMLLKKINQIQESMKAARRKPTIEKEAAESIERMKRKEGELEELLMDYTRRTGQKYGDPALPRRPWYESPAGSDPFGKLY